MKKLFKIKFELIQLIAMLICTILIVCVTYMNDYKSIILYFALFAGCIFSFVSYKPVKNFRKEVLKKW